MGFVFSWILSYCFIISSIIILNILCSLSLVALDERHDMLFLLVLVFQGCHNKTLQTGWHKQQNSFPLGSIGGMLKVKVRTGLVSSEASLLGLQMALFLLDLYMVILLCICACTVMFFAFKYLLTALLKLDQGQLSQPHFNLITSLKFLS